MKSTDIVIVGAARTPQGRLKGALASFSGAQLGSFAIQGALSQGNVNPEQVDAVVMGQVLQAGAGQNPARQAALGAGIPQRSHAVTVNKVCLSGLASIIDASRMLHVGDATVVVAGGMESMTQAPHIMNGSRYGWSYGSFEVLDTMAHDGLTDASEGINMGSLTEKHNAALSISRKDQDSVAALSHQRAAQARDEGVFAREITPVEVPQRRGEPIIVAHDEGIRDDTTVEGLAGLRPAFTPEGTITAASSSQISDGAAAVVLTTREHADANGWSVLARLGAPGQVAGPDNSLQSQPANAIAAALKREGLNASALDFVEINEAFAAVVVQSARELGLDDTIINIHGGGIALGHPIGASGARLVVHAAHELAHRGSGTAAVALCGGGGQGEALILHAAQ